MPSTHQRAAGSSIPSRPAVEEEYGENPYRFLECGRRFLEARLRGIEDMDLLVEYLRAERDRDPGPRRSRITMIQDRIAEVRDG